MLKIVHSVASTQEKPSEKQSILHKKRKNVDGIYCSNGG